MIPINKWFDKLKKFINDRGIKTLENVDFKPIEKILKRLESKRGSPPTYSNISKFKAVIYGMMNGAYSACAIARKATSEVAKKVCGLDRNISHDRINEFLKDITVVVEEIFQELVKQVMKLGITNGKKQAIDGTSIETMFLSDRDAKWSYDDTKDEYYFGYGLLVNFCTETHLPLAAEFTQSKKVSYKEVKRVVDKTPVIPETFLGDPEFDMIKLHKLQISKGVRIVVPYNSRKTKEPKKIKYRIQQWFPELTNKELNGDYKERLEGEHAISTLKEHFSLEKFYVKGWNRVKVHTFLCMISRLMHAIAVHKTNPFVSVRKTITIL